MRSTRKKKILSKIVKIMIVILVIAIGVKFREMMEMSKLLGKNIQEYEAYMRTLENVSSDIEGMTVYDKYVAGLDCRSGADSDYDGLTDKEEIEVYGTDPLRASTAGDLYSDGYKVENEMDLRVYYEYEESIQFQYNSCQEIMLNADEPTDFYAVVEDYTDRYSLKDYGIDKIYKGYWLYNYSGSICIDLNLLSSGGVIDISDMNIWIIPGDFLVHGVSKLEKCKYDISENEIRLEYSFRNDESYYIFITDKRNVAASIVSVLKNTSMSQINGSMNETGIAFICGSPVLEQLFNVTGHIYYSELSDESKNDVFRNKTVEYCNSTVLGSEITVDDKEKVIPTDAAGVRKWIDFFKTVFPVFEAKPVGEETVFNYIFNYDIYVDEGYSMGTGASGSIDGEEEIKQYKNYHTDFNPYKDELPFQNFESEYGPDGNCSGISHLTATLFNTGTAPQEGRFNGIKWNIGIDDENSTLVDLELFDYKSKDFVDDNSNLFDNYIGEGLSAGETEFVKMIGAYLQEANEKANLNEYAMTDGRMNDWDMAERMIAYLDQGKILCAGMLFKNYTGHEVNIYDYYYTDAGELIFRVYDSNIPQDNRAGYELTCDDGCYLQCKKVIRKDGTSAFTYLYWPIKGNIEYMASSNKSLMEINSIVVTDESWNILN